MGGTRFLTVLLIGLAGALLPAASAGATTFEVNSTEQQGDASPGNGVCATGAGVCTLRAALSEANALLGPDTVNVPPGEYPVNSWTPTISQSLTLRGTGGSRVTRLDSLGSTRTWSITGGGSVEIEGLTFTGVNGSSSTVSVSGPDTTFTDVSINGNRSSSSGAGLRIDSSQVTMVRSAVTNNLVATNLAQTLGGGIAVYGGSFTALASTISDNRIQSTGTTAWGGGIFTNGPMVLRHVTIAGNSVQTSSAASYGGNLYINTGSQTSIQDSILVDGSTGSGALKDCGIAQTGATLTTTGNNIYLQLGGFDCQFSTGTVSASTTGLTELDDHGGTGMTLVPLPGSPAADGASGCPDGGLDQRGAKAPTGTACDIGAAELNTDLRMSLNSAPGPFSPGATVFHTAVLGNHGLDTATNAALQISPAGDLTIVAVSDGSCNANGACSFGTLTPGMSRTVTFTTRAPATGPLVTTVTGSSDTPDPTPEDSSASTTTGILAAPVISKLRTVGKLRSGKPGKISFRLSRAAAVKILVNRKGKKKRLGVLTAKGKAGRTVIKLPARLKGKKLAPGRYILAATATSGGLRSKTVRTTVKVLKVRKK